MFLFFSSSQSLSLSRTQFSTTLRSSCLNSSAHKLTYSLPPSSRLQLLIIHGFVKDLQTCFFCDLWSVVEYRKLQLQTKNGLIATRSCNKKKGVCTSCVPYSKCKMGFSSDTPTLGFPVGSEICLGPVLQPTSPSLRFRFLSSWVEFPICQSYLPGTPNLLVFQCRRDKISVGICGSHVLVTRR